MKTIFTLISGLLMSMVLMGTPPGFDPKMKSMLTIKSTGQGDIRVVVDGKKFDPRRQSIAIRNIRPGVHNVKIYRRKSIGFFEMFRSRYELVFNRPVLIRKHTHVMISIDRLGRPFIDQKRIKGNSRQEDWYPYRNYDGSFDRNREFGYENEKRYESDNKSGRDYDRSGNIPFEEVEMDYDHDGNPGDFEEEFEYNENISKSLGDREFNTVLQSIQKEWFEGNKVKSASQVISGNYFTAVQVKQLLQLFSFENNKLQLAKQAYSKTVDPGNYMRTVGDVFSFSSSRDELARFIRNNQ